MAEERNSLTSRAAFRWIWRGYMKAQAPLFAAALLAMAIEGGMLGLLSYMMKPMFDQVFISAQRAAIYSIAGIFFAIFCIRAISTVLQKWLLAKGLERISAELRQQIFTHVLSLDGDFHRKMPQGYLMQRIEGDVTQLKIVLAGVIRGYGRDVVALIALTAVAIQIDWRWALVASVGIPALIAPTAFVQKYVRREAQIARETAAKLSNHISESLTAIEEVKLNTIETYQTKRYLDLNTRAVHAETRSALGQSIIPGLIDIMAGIGFLAVLAYGAVEIIDGHKTVGDFMAFFTALGLAFDPLRRLGGLSGQWQIGITVIERMSEILSAKSIITAPAEPVKPQIGPQEIVFDQVNVAYGEKPVLRDISFRAAPGTVTAIVGPSGAGKTTLFKAIGRLIPLSSGQIRFNGHDIAAYSLTDLRAMLSMVGQEALLFDETLRDNLCFDQAIEAEQFEAVLKDAHIDRFASRLPNGLDTRLGVRGSALSGGQRQRVAIARALLRDTPILLMDEATSALDAQSEQIVQAALERLSKGRTTMVIAHRLSTVRNADHIVVLNEGHLVEEGNHDTLLEKGGLYAQLIQMQFDRSE